ncbi:MAG: chorismate synthase [Deltaproteobacteria bacterium]|nr:chorismate synthase [Deltaproteobacteria bacterium]
MSSTFGTLLKVVTFGESHGKGVGAVLDGCPSKINLSEADIQRQLDRRRPGQSKLTTKREEPDRVTILSGVEHADYTYQMKYGIRSVSGGGRSSARETVGRVAAGAIADKFLFETFGIEIVAWVQSVGDVEASFVDVDGISREDVDQTIVRCPDRITADRMIQCIDEVRDRNDSIGGAVTCVCRNVPPGLGEPVFDKVEAKLAQAMLSIPATKGFEIGSGFAGARMLGSQHNDPFILKGERLGTKTNFSGGVQGGITNGEPIVFRVAFKPPATIGVPQKTVDFEGKQTVLEAKGRHDPCVVPRAVPIIECMAALVIGDFALQQKYREP